MFGILQRALFPSLMMFANAFAGESTNVASSAIHETLQGHFVYMKNCVFCHGKRGDGKGDMGLTVQPPPRDFGAGRVQIPIHTFRFTADAMWKR
jgi:mono/diheme cytochrome c family protein